MIAFKDLLVVYYSMSIQKIQI